MSKEFEFLREAKLTSTSVALEISISISLSLILVVQWLNNVSSIPKFCVCFNFFHFLRLDVLSECFRHVYWLGYSSILFRDKVGRTELKCM